MKWPLGYLKVVAMRLRCVLRTSTIKHTHDWLEKHTVWLFLAGLTLTGVSQVRMWTKDRQRQARWQPEATSYLEEDSWQPEVSILLPAWNEDNNIDACLRALLSLRYPHKQIVVCAGGTDSTLAHAQAYTDQGVIVLAQHPGEGKQRALRRCYQNATGEVIYLTDADCIVDDLAFESVIAPVIAGEAASTGTWRPLDRQTDDPFVQYQWAHHAHRELWMSVSAPALDGRNAAVARWALDDVGAFNLDAPIGTDFVLSKQLTTGGYDIRFVPGSRVQTEYPGTPRAYLKQQSRWFRNPVVLGWQWGERSLAAGVLSAGIKAVLLLAMPAIILITRWRAALTLWLSALVYLWLSALRSMRMLSRLRSQSFGIFTYTRLLFYLPIGWIAMALGLRDLLLSRRRMKW